MTSENTQTVYTVLDVLSLLPLLWVAFYAASAIFTGGARITSGRGGGVVFTVCILWLAVRFLSVYKGLGWFA